MTDEELSKIKNDLDVMGTIIGRQARLLLAEVERLRQLLNQAYFQRNELGVSESALRLEVERLRAENERNLAFVYRHSIGGSLAVADVCDTILDRSGGMLGRIRSIVFKMRQEDE